MIQHNPHPGEVLYCNFEDLKPPEMTKSRKVIVLSPRSRDFAADTFMVVPVSKSFRPASSHQCEFKPHSYFFFDEKEPVWAVCDMVTTVARRRLNGIRFNNRNVKAQISAADLERVRRCVLAAMGMGNWMHIDETTKLTIAVTTTEVVSIDKDRQADLS
jgi:uncharacterized protein YifN (PemK superfamily)